MTQHFYQGAEEFINEEFWKGTHDSRSSLNIPQIVNEKLILDDKNKDNAYYDHREGVVHVSSLTRCLRGVVLEMLGAKPDSAPDARKLGVFKAGNLFEDYIIDCLGDKVVHKQREYVYKYKSLTLVGRSDYTINDNGVLRVGENKSVHSESFWYREKEGTIVAWNNQVQLQVYMWLERLLNGNNWDGIFSYISKDDCTVVGAPIKFNQKIIDEVVIPALDAINEAYTKKDANLAIVPPMVVYNKSKGMFMKNWIATYCNFHNQCVGEGWLLEAGAEVARKNKENKARACGEMSAHLIKKDKPNIEVIK
jgi:hypothetical protein